MVGVFGSILLVFIPRGNTIEVLKKGRRKRMGVLG
jgi:hypothetical protein